MQELIGEDRLLQYCPEHSWPLHLEHPLYHSACIGWVLRNLLHALELKCFQKYPCAPSCRKWIFDWESLVHCSIVCQRAFSLIRFSHSVSNEAPYFVACNFRGSIYIDFLLFVFHRQLFSSSFLDIWSKFLAPLTFQWVLPPQLLSHFWYAYVFLW